MSKSAGIGKFAFYTFPSSKKEFNQQLKNSQLLSSLWNQSFDQNNDTLNSPKTLPIPIKPKVESDEEIKMQFTDKTGASLKIKQYMSYGKLIIQFYRKGVSNVWQNRKEMSKLKKYDFKLINSLDNKGKTVDIRIPSFAKLTSDMSQALYSSQVESKTYNDSTRGDVIHSNVMEKDIDESLFNLSRHQYQLLKRTPSDFMKLPTFAIIFMIFFELTPLLCYAFPKITPQTCLLPSLLPRVWNSSASIKLSGSTRNLDRRERELLAHKSAYSLSLSDIRLLSRALLLTSRYIPIFLYPETTIRRRLQEYYNYLKVDNYYLSGLNGKLTGNIWNLSNQELVHAALERNLIIDLKSDTNEINSIKEIYKRSEREEEYLQELRIKLFRFIVDFERYNIGYLLLTDQVKDSPDTKNIIQWRNSQE